MPDSLSERWNAISLRSKITGVTVLMLTVGLLVSGIGTMAMLKPYLYDQVDAQLATVSQGSNLGTFFNTDQSGKDSGQLETTVQSGPSDYFVAVFDPYGELLDNNWKDRPRSTLPVLPDMTLDLSTAHGLSDHVISLTSKDGLTEFHALVTPVLIGDGMGTLGTALVAVSLQETANILATYLTIFLGFGIVVTVLGALLTRLLVTSTFTPLREVEATAAAIADGDFSQRISGVTTPNTEVGRLNRSLNTMLSRIDRAFTDRAKTIEQMRRFVGDASHELRTPLVTVRGYAELYRMGALATPDEVAQAMERIEKEAIRMGGLVEDLLELARLDEARPQNFAPVDLVPLANDAAMDSMAASPAREIRVFTRVEQTADSSSGSRSTPPGAAEPQGSSDETDTVPTPATGPIAAATGPAAFGSGAFARLRHRRPRRPGQPATTAQVPQVSVPVGAPSPEIPAVVMGDENKIRQVLTNLLANAMRFTPPDSPLEIGVVVIPATERVVLEVIDHGEGIAPQIREQIFQRFWRADTSRARETGGSGLGLAIVSSIVAAHNGTVDTVETPGGGATFRVSLPLATSPSAPQPVARPESPSGA